MEKQVISQKIIEDANEQAQKIVAQALENADKNVSNANAKAQEIIEQSTALAKKEGELSVERRKTLARLDSKKIILNGKQQIIASAFEHAKNLLLSMNKTDYLRFVEKNITAHAEKGDRILLCSSAPVTVQEILNLPVVKERELQVESLNNFGGGIKIIGEKSDKDLSFSAILAEYSANNMHEITAILFK